MSEQWIPTTAQVRLGFAESPVDEYYDRGERAFNRWLEQVKREAKAEELRKVSEYFERSIVPNGAEIGSWLRARADRMEAGE